MESPCALLKQAVYENDPDTQIQLVVRACKIITDTLPFERKNHLLVEEPELMKFLMLTIPINPRSVDLIVNSMINKFNKVHYFLKEIWMGFISIAEMEETGNKLIQKSESPVRLFQFSVKKLLNLGTLKDLDPASGENSPTNARKVHEFCDVITASKETIKITVLNYVERIIELYIKELRNTVAFKPDIADLLKKFIRFSPSNKVIIRVCSIIEKVNVGLKLPTLNREIEDMVIHKQQTRMIEETNDSYLPSKTSIDNAPTTNKFSKLRVKVIPSSVVEVNKKIVEPLSSADLKIQYDSSARRNFSLPGSQRAQEAQNADSKDEPDLDSSELDDRDNPDQAYIRLENWLASYEINDIPLISKNTRVNDFLQNQGSFELLLSFIFDPYYHTITDRWQINYSIATDPLDDSKTSNRVAHTPSTASHVRYAKLREEKASQAYILRSFKTMQSLCDLRNIKFIVQHHHKAFDKYFSYLYVCLMTKEDSICNLNHVAKITEYLLRNESDVCINFIIYYNFLFKFIQNVDYPYMQIFLLTLFSCSGNSENISEEAFQKIIKYCNLTSFFKDVGDIILYGTKSLDIKKFEVDYKPHGVESILNGAMNSRDFDALFEGRPLPDYTASENSFAPEEVKGIKVDIDNIYNLGTPKKKQTGANKFYIKQKTFMIKPLANSVIKKYHSLREKYPEESDTTDRSDEGYELNIDIIPESDMSPIRRTPSQSTKMKLSNLGLSPIVPQLLNSANKLAYKANDTNNLISRTTTSSLSYSKSTKNFNTPSPFKPNENIPSSDLYGNSAENRTKTSYNTRNAANVNLDFIKVDDTRPTKTGKLLTDRAETNATSMLPQIKEKSNLSTTKREAQSFQITSNTKRTNKMNFVEPMRMTLSNEFRTDSMSVKEAQHLNVLYPISYADRVESELDKEAKRSEFTVYNIKSNDVTSIPLCSFIETLFRKIFSSSPEPPSSQELSVRSEDEGKKAKYQLKRKIGTVNVGYANLLNLMFEEDKFKLFDSILKNYLLKIKIHHLEDNDSGFISGRIVNLILRKCESRSELMKPFIKNIHKSCRNHLKFLCKNIIQSHAWNQPSDQKHYIQTLEIKEPLGAARILLAETLNFIITNDREDHYSSLHDINDTCWHTLMIWLFQDRTNTIYQGIFISILEKVFTHGTEKLALIILLKLDLLSNLYKTWNEIYKNNVYMKDSHSESIIHAIKKIMNIIETTSNQNPSFTNLQKHLAKNGSWNYLKSKLIPKRVEKKTNSVISGRKSTTRHTKLLDVPSFSHINSRSSISRGSPGSRDFGSPKTRGSLMNLK